MTEFCNINDINDEKYRHFCALQEEVMTLERILLQTIKFDLRVEHPYSYILKYAKNIKGDKDKVQKLIQMAWTFINDRSVHLKDFFTIKLD